MSHEIRTPMNAIINFCDLLTRTKLSKKQKEYLRIIHSSSRSLLEIINDILDLSKIEAGKIEFEKSPVSIRKIIEEVSEMFRHIIEEKKIKYEVEIAPDVASKVMTDPLRLRQILINLVSNAIKFTEKGQISISVKSKPIRKHTAKLLFCVKDTGIGITHAIQDQLFDSFTQADSSITRKYGGTGLGLTICKKIIDLMGGNIWVDSKPKVGSSFFFTLKFKIASIEDILDRPIFPQLKKLRSLVVSGDRKSIQMIKSSLEHCGAHIQTASSAESALSLHQNSIEKKPFDLIFMDIRQPGMDGLRASRKIKNIKCGKVPAIILINVSGRKDDMKIIQETGIEAILMKPLSQSLILDSILNVFMDNTANRIPELNDIALPGEFTDVRILLVEDNPVNRMVATEVLNIAGFSVDKAINGIEAVKAVKNKTYDAVLMDIQMPEMDGIEATRIIRKRFKKVDLPIIAMTAHAMRGDKEKFLNAGMNSYIAKPVDCEELFAILRQNIPKVNMPKSKQIESGRLRSKIDSKSFGLDLSDGLNRIGSYEKYIEILKEFWRDHKNIHQEFRKLVINKKLKAARLKAHSLKGAAANVSAKYIRLAAENLEISCKNNNEKQILNGLKAIERGFTQLSNYLKNIKRGSENCLPTDFKKKSVDIKRVLQMAKKLDSRLLDCDPTGSKFYFTKISNYLFPDALIEDRKIMEQQICNYQFDDARKTLKIIVTQLKRLCV